MNKLVKLIITVVVVILIILYFLRDSLFRMPGPTPPPQPVASPCSTFEQTLSSRIEQYFMDKLPESDGEVNSVKVGDLITSGVLTLQDLSNVGATCVGEAYVSKANNNYYYYNNISCGTCSIQELYDDWGEWVDSLPSSDGKKRQVMTSLLFNYSDSKTKFTDWTEWGEKIDELKAPEVPAGSEIVKKEVENKTQYQYRDAAYKWYKISSNAEYYVSNSNKQYKETTPGSSYSRDDSSRKTLRVTKTYESESKLKSSENVKKDDLITKVSAYITGTPRYIYSYTEPITTITVCNQYKPLYKCYKYDRGQPISLGSYPYNSADEALRACNASSNNYIGCAATSQTVTKYWERIERKCQTGAYGFQTGTPQTVTTDCTNEANSSISVCNQSNAGKSKITCTATKWTPEQSKCESQTTYSFGSSQAIDSTVITNAGACDTSSPYNEGCLGDSTVLDLFKNQKCHTDTATCTSNSDVGKENVTSCSINYYTRCRGTAYYKKSYTCKDGASFSVTDTNPICDCSSHQGGGSKCSITNLCKENGGEVSGSYCYYYGRLSSCPSGTYTNSSPVRTSFKVTYKTCQKNTGYSYTKTNLSETTSCNAGTAPTCSSSNAGSTYITKCTPSAWTKTSELCTTGVPTWGNEAKTIVDSDCTAEANSSITTCNESNLNKSKISCRVNETQVKYGYTAYTSVKQYYNNGAKYTSCPSGYNQETTGEYSTTECVEGGYTTQTTGGTTHYLKKDGTTTTNKNQAAQLTVAEYNALKNKNSGLSKYSRANSPSSYDFTNGTLREGTCPSGAAYQCKTLYKATIYTYLWYKTTTAEKTWCNNGTLSISSPGSGCIKDESTAKWGEWSIFSDKKVEASTSREVNQKTTSRYRLSYIDAGTLKLKEWLPLEEFEAAVGKTIEELKADENINVQTKTVYKYRTLK